MALKKNNAKPAAAKKSVGFSADTKPAALPKGVVAASASNGKKKQQKPAAPEPAAEESEDEEDDASDVDSDDLSSEDGDDRLMALEFRFLPSQFQEPELRQYLGQFGTTVSKVVCLRHKASNSSRGIALATFGDNNVLPVIIEECNGMLLGGRTVRCRRVFLKKDLPPMKIVTRRYMADLRRRTRGAKMTRFVNAKHQDTETILKAPKAAKEGNTTAAEREVETKNIVGGLIKYSQREKEHNKALKAMGINYSFSGFQDQYKQIPKDKIITKKEKRAKRNRDSDE